MPFATPYLRARVATGRHAFEPDDPACGDGMSTERDEAPTKGRSDGRRFLCAMLRRTAEEWDGRQENKLHRQHWALRCLQELQVQSSDRWAGLGGRGRHDAEEASAARLPG